MKMMGMNGLFNGSNGSSENSTNGKKGNGFNVIGNSTGIGKGMGMKMNMAINATDDSLLLILEEDRIPGGKGGGKSMYATSGNSTGSGNGGKGAQRDKRGPEGVSMGMMMKSSDLDALSPSPSPKSKRNMFRQNRNSTNPSSFMQNIMHSIHHSNVSVVDLNHTVTSGNKTESNSTIGNLLKQFRMGLNQGFHHGQNNSTSIKNSSSHTELADDENETRFPRLKYLWDKLMNRMASNSTDANDTTMIGTQMWKLFNEKK
jgi:hypothetical protein